MTAEPAIDPIMQGALARYFWADNAPGVAQALREHRKSILAARASIGELINALEWSGSYTIHRTLIELRHPDLLTSHQATWGRASDLRHLGIRDAQVLYLMKGIWTNVFLNLIVDKCLRCSTVQSFGRVQLVRLFGSMQPTLSNTPMRITDGSVAVLWTPCRNVEVLKELSIPDHSIPFGILLDALGSFLKTGEFPTGRPLPSLTDRTRFLYSYGPLDGYDLEVRLDALRDFAVALDYVACLQDDAADNFTSRIKDKTPVWEYLHRHNIGATAFVEAIRRYKRAVEVHAVEVALSRYRRRLPGATASARAKHPRNQKKKNAGCSPKKRHGHSHSKKSAPRRDEK